jgi:hypothetical protein
MKKKIIVSLSVLTLSLGVGAVAFAAENRSIDFGRILPHMQQMHPNLTTEQLKDMHKECQQTGGSEQSRHVELMKHMMGF